MGGVCNFASSKGKEYNDLNINTMENTTNSAPERSESLATEPVKVKIFRVKGYLHVLKLNMHNTFNEFYEKVISPLFVKSSPTNATGVLLADGTDIPQDTFQPALPSYTGNSGKVLAVNSGATGVEWVTQSGGGTAHKETVYAVCSTAAATQTKEITVSEMPEHGDLIVVNFGAGISVDNPVLRVSDGNQYVDLAMLFCGIGIPSGTINAGNVAIFSVDFNYRRARMISTDQAAATALSAVKIYNGTDDPLDSLGNDGDIYIETEL